MTLDQETEYWKEEMRRWIEGYTTEEGHTLKGFHYFYLTQIKIKTEDGDLIHPVWRDVDEMVINAWYEALEQELDLCIFKRRGIGLSVMFAAMALWRLLTKPGSTYLMTSNNRPKSQRLFNEKVLVSFEHLDPWIKPEHDSKRQDGQLVIRPKDHTGKETGVTSTILARQTSDSRKDAAAFESERAVGGFLDEELLHPYPQEVRRSMQSCLKKGMSKMGPLVMGGSAGIVSEAGIKEAETTWKNADTMRIKVVFIPGTYGVDLAPVREEDGKTVPNTYYNFCPNGYSYHKECNEWINKERELLDRSEEKGDLIGFIKSYPLEINDIFELNDVGIIPPELLPRMNRQKKEILNADRPISRYQLVDMLTDIRAAPDRDGNTYILEHPEPGEEYIMGIDPIPTVDTKVKESKDGKTKDRSMYAAVVKRRSTQEYVAYYEQRSSDINVIKLNTLNLQKYYNNAIAMVERNQGRELILQYRNDGDSPFLAKYPTILGMNGVDKRETTGFHKDKWNSERIYKFFFKYLKEHMERIWIMKIIDQLPSFVISNTDLLDAIVACEIYDQQLQRKDERFTGKARVEERPYMTIENGKYVRRWKKITTFEGSEDDPRKNYPTQWMSRTPKPSSDQDQL